jgi:hypothetical protein
VDRGERQRRLEAVTVLGPSEGLEVLRVPVPVEPLECGVQSGTACGGEEVGDVATEYLLR